MCICLRLVSQLAEHGTVVFVLPRSISNIYSLFCNNESLNVRDDTKKKKKRKKFENTETRAWFNEPSQDDNASPSFYLREEIPVDHVVFVFDRARCRYYRGIPYLGPVDTGFRAFYDQAILRNGILGNANLRSCLAATPRNSPPLLVTLLPLLRSWRSCRHVTIV